jgi:NADH:ubiquinone oxidoreductase subunit C
MNAEELKQEILAFHPTVTFDDGGQFVNANIDGADVLAFLSELRTRPAFDFDYMFCLTCVDYKTHFTMFYHLRSLTHRHEMVVKAKIADINSPAVDTVSHIWRTADFMEREVFDLFGVKFFRHPDLRRIFLDENWPGHPLRKNYEDPNMIEL